MPLHHRVIPCLLLKNKGLVKTLKFRDPRYVGDPINAVKVFNQKEVDELVFLDIERAKSRESPDFDLLEDIATEAFMPMAYGGGLGSLRDIERVYSTGFEKVVLNSITHDDPRVVSQAVALAGSSGVIASVDVKKNMFGSYGVYGYSGEKKSKLGVIDFVKQMADLGVGEILLGFVSRDGTGDGYDYQLIEEVCSAVSVPVVPVGGAANLQDFRKAVEAGASGVSAGSMFVFYGKHRAVLINYPEYETLRDLFK